MKVYKEYSLQVKFEIDCITKDFFIKKKQKLIKEKEYRFIVASEEEAQKKAKELEEKGLDFLRKEIEHSLKTMKKYELHNWGDFIKTVIEIFSVEKAHSKLNETTDFSTCSVDYAFRNLTIQQFQDMWGSRIMIE